MERIKKHAMEKMEPFEASFYAAKFRLKKHRHELGKDIETDPGLSEIAHEMSQDKSELNAPKIYVDLGLVSAVRKQRYRKQVKIRYTYEVFVIAFIEEMFKGLEDGNPEDHIKSLMEVVPARLFTLDTHRSQD